MANGQPFDYRKKTVALWFLPLGTMVRITNLSNGLSVVAEVTDRGPAHTLHRIADLSQAAAEALDFLQEGVATVLIQPVIEVETVPTEIVMTLAEPEIPVEKKEIASIITP
jgi:rare lipoprotein A